MKKERQKVNSDKQIKIGAILSYVQMALNTVVGLAYTPIMIRLLGQSEYGLYNTVSSTISMLSILSLGFNASYVRYYSKYKKDNDSLSIYRLNGLFLLVFSIIGIIALICGLFLTNNLNLVFDKGLTSSEYSTAFVLMLLLTINLAVSFPMSVFASIISANERFVFLKLLGTIRTVFSPLVTLPLLLMGYKSIAMVAVTVACNIMVDSIYAIYVLKVLKNKFYFKNFEKGLFSDLLVYTSFIAINMIVEQINWNIDKVLLGRFKGTAEVAIYSVGFTIYQYYHTFSTSISGVFTPRIHNIFNANRDNQIRCDGELTKLFIKVGRIQFLILALVASGFVFFGQYFILLWVGEGYESAYYVALLMMFPAMIPLIQNLGIEIQRAKNLHKFRSIAYALMACVNLGLSIFLCQWYGSIGSAAGTAFSVLLANGLIMNIYYHRKCGIDIITFWKNIISMMKGLIIPIGLAIISLRFIAIDNVWKLLTGIILYSTLYVVSMWLFGINKDEKNLFIAPIKKLKNRR